MRAGLRVCRNPTRRHWQLGPLPPSIGHLTLIGWSAQPADEGDGVPQPIVRVLSRALTSVARVTFPTSAIAADTADAWSVQNGDHIRRFGQPGVAGRLLPKLSGAPSVFGLCSTTRPESAARLFDDGGFPWWLQGQVVVLSPVEGPPPNLSEATWRSLFNEDWLQAAMMLDANGVEGVLRPGVDGDVAGLFTWTETIERAILNAMELEARAAALECVDVPEAGFAAG